MAYNYVQTFFLDSQAVGGSNQVLLSSVDLYLKTRPNRNVNRSGLTNPSISVQICPANRERPNVASMQSQQRSTLTWDEIVISNNASSATTFTFDPPIPLLTENYYGIYIQVSDDEYSFWEAVQGDKLVGTNTPTSGPAGKYDGNLFEGVTEDFRAKTNKDLKFKVNVAKFSANTLAANAVLVPEKYEFLRVNNINGKFAANEKVFVDYGSPNLSVPVLDILPGSLFINASSTRVEGNGTSFNSTVSNGSIIVLSTPDDVNNFAIVTVNNVVNSTVLNLTKIPGISSNGFNGQYKISPTSSVFEAEPYYGKSNELILFRSTANSTYRFVNSSLNGVTVSNTGAGYSNTNIVRIVNAGGVDATYAISTNNSGSISSLRVLNPGEGFALPVSNVRIEVSISDNTLKSGNPGANAVISVANSQIGSVLRGQFSKSTANIVSVENKQISEFWPVFQEINTINGKIITEHAFSNGENFGSLSTLFEDTKLGVLNNVRNYPATLASYSNELEANTESTAQFRVNFEVDKTNDFLFESPFIDVNRSTIRIYENDINNDYANEHTNYGNALSKSISKRISFNADTVSEDLILYLRANRPFGTSLKVFAKFHNNVDDEAFDDKLWTELQQVTPDRYTPLGDDESLVDIQYKLPQYPESETTLAGLVSTSNNSTTITGVGTSFSNTLVGRLIKVYSPLLPQNHQVVPVSSVTNSTSLIVSTPIVNNSIQESVVGDGLKVDLLKYVGTAYNNIQNDNVIRYYTISNQAEIDGFDSLSVKIVFLSQNKYLVPSVEDVRMIGVTA
jgi:hypothetical protein